MRLAIRFSAILALLSVGALAACTASDDEASADMAAIQTADTSLGEEMEPNEPALAEQIAAAAVRQVAKSRAQDSQHVARRDAHAKAHGCVKASFTVDSNVPDDLAVGTFEPGRRYDAWIRFSNGGETDDRKNDPRGMAMKVLGVDGPRLLVGEEPTAHTHDFIFVNHHTFFLKDLSTFVKFINTVVDTGNPFKFFVSLNPFDFRLKLREMMLAQTIATREISSPLTSRYWSMTPYKLGDQAVKYGVRPCGGADTSGDHPDDPNYLGQALKSGLADGKTGCFEFMIQRRTKPAEMPVEDVTKTWDEDDSEFIPVARIDIPSQTFDSDAQRTYCENLSFTPWHATTEHRPLGRINRARKVVYEATSTARHKMNDAPRAEPTDLVVR